MALRTFVKISHVTNLSDARYCAGMGVDQLGFNLNPNDTDVISPEKLIELKGWIAGVHFVGEFGTASIDEIMEIQRQVPLDIIEVSAVSNVEKVHLLGKPVSVSLDIWNENQILELKSQLSYLDELATQVVINSNIDSLFEKINEAVRHYAGSIRLIKGFDVNEASVHTQTNFKGIQLIGSEEEQPGFKDYGLIMDLLEALEID